MRYLKIIGADAVGFSTVQEVIAAMHAGMRILGLSTITNISDPDAPLPATMEEIVAVATRPHPKWRPCYTTWWSTSTMTPSRPTS